jgi:hypothetical protein
MKETFPTLGYLMATLKVYVAVAVTAGVLFMLVTAVIAYPVVVTCGIAIFFAGMEVGHWRTQLGRNHVIGDIVSAFEEMFTHPHLPAE